MNLLLSSIIGDNTKAIQNAFKRGNSYNTKEINETINKILEMKLNQYTTTQILKQVHNVKDKVVRINGEFDREFKIL